MTNDGLYGSSLMTWYMARVNDTWQGYMARFGANCQWPSGFRRLCAKEGKKHSTPSVTPTMRAQRPPQNECGAMRICNLTYAQGYLKQANHDVTALYDVTPRQPCHNSMPTVPQLNANHATTCHAMSYQAMSRHHAMPT